MPGYGLTWAEGHPAPGGLATSSEITDAAEHVRALLEERVGVIKDAGVARFDSTVTTRFALPQETRAFIAGMSAFQLPRTETTRRGHPPHSVSWVHPQGRRILARLYDKGHERGGERWELARLEDQRRTRSGARTLLEAVVDPEYRRNMFRKRFGPIRKAVEGVKAATLPVIQQALVDEAQYGLITHRELERRAGALLLLSGGIANDVYPRSTLKSRRRELREAGYVVVDEGESAEVNLGDVIEQALAEDGWT